GQELVASKNGCSQRDQKQQRICDIIYGFNVLLSGNQSLWGQRQQQHDGDRGQNPDQEHTEKKQNGQKSVRVGSANSIIAHNPPFFTEQRQWIVQSL
ncbi:MAG: hypothetical protein ACPGYL_07515, partial [Rhodospirillaceae bacterium]